MMPKRDRTAYMKAWRAKNPENVTEASRRYREKHREQVNTYQREYYKNHHKTYRYVYPNCSRIDCDWIEEQLNEWRKEHVTK